MTKNKFFKSFFLLREQNINRKYCLYLFGNANKKEKELGREETRREGRRKEGGRERGREGERRRKKEEPKEKNHV